MKLMNEKKTVIKNQDGLTLIELMAALTIMAIIGTIVWSVLINGMNSSNKSKSDTNLQQHGNYIMTLINQQHLVAGYTYKIKIQHNNDASIITLSEIMKDGTETITHTIDEGQYVYKLFSKDIKCNTVEITTSKIVDPKALNYSESTANDGCHGDGNGRGDNDGSLFLQLEIRDKKSGNEYRLQTTFSRL